MNTSMSRQPAYVNKYFAVPFLTSVPYWAAMIGLAEFFTFIRELAPLAATAGGSPRDPNPFLASYQLQALNLITGRTNNYIASNSFNDLLI